MGSYISLGFVSASEKTAFLRTCKDVINFFTINIKNAQIKYPIDSECSEWISENVNVNNLEKALNICYEYNYSELMLDYEINGRLISGVLFTITRNIGNLFGALFEIPEKNFDMLKEIDFIENEIINIMNQSILLGIEYIFCDNECNIEYLPSEIISKDNIYSILIYRHNEKNIIKLASWKIDGLTNRS